MRKDIIKTLHGLGADAIVPYTIVVDRVCDGYNILMP